MISSKLDSESLLATIHRIFSPETCVLVNKFASEGFLADCHRAIFTPNAHSGVRNPHSHAKNHSFEWALAWLGERSIFQTFEELDSIIDKETELKEIRQLLDNNTGSLSEEV